MTPLRLNESPQPWSEFREGKHYYEGNLAAWRALEEAHRAGKLRAIGVSNSEREDIDNVFDNGSVKPMVDQILAHVGATPFDLIDYSRSKGMLVEAYSPVAHGAVLNKPELAAPAEKYSVGVAGLCIRYDADMATLRGVGIDYGEASAFPVFGKKRHNANATTGG